jgi:hypothetical protein
MSSGSCRLNIVSVGANSTQIQLCSLVILQEQLRDCYLARAVYLCRFSQDPRRSVTVGGVDAIPLAIMSRYATITRERRGWQQAADGEANGQMLEPGIVCCVCDEFSWGRKSRQGHCAMVELRIYLSVTQTGKCGEGDRPRVDHEWSLRSL